MTLIIAGYLQDTYIAEDYLMIDYIPEYGTPIISPAIYPSRTFGRKKEKLILTVWDDPEFLELLTEFIEVM